MPKKQLELIGEQVLRWMRGLPAQMSNMGEASGRAVADEGDADSNS